MPLPPEDSACHPTSPPCSRRNSSSPDISSNIFNMGPEKFTHDEHASDSSSSQGVEPVPLHQPAPHAEHGPVIDHKIPQEDAIQASPDLTWSRIRRYLREPLAEFFVCCPMSVNSVLDMLTIRPGCLHSDHVWRWCCGASCTLWW